jgi:multidrug resistance efflux pump
MTQMPQEKNTQGRPGRKIALMLVLIALGLTIFVIWRLDTAPRTDDAYAYADTINVAPEVSGRIVELAVEDNQRVKKGDVLFRIDPRPFQARLTKSQASLIELEREIELKQRSVNSQKLGAAAATASIERARAAAEQAGDTLGRLEPLLGTKYVSAEQVDQARTAKRSADAQLNTAMLDAQRAAAGVSGVDALVSKRDVLQAEIELARLNLEYATVRAPFDGVVNEHFIQPGEHVDAGEQALELVNPDQPDIRLRAPIAWARQLATQARLRVEGEQLSSHAIYYQRAASADPKSRLIELRLKPEAGTFIIGSPVRVALPMGEQHTMLLPRDALVLGTEGSVVYQVEQRGEALTVNRVPVTVLFGDSREVAVSGALKQGDKVVVRGAGSLQDGDKVELFRG